MRIPWALVILPLVALAAAGVPVVPPVPTTGIDLPMLGQVSPRHAKDIASSSWSIGGETMDRDFTVYDHYKKYLGPLGAKGLRLQAGWAKCEKLLPDPITLKIQFLIG